MESLKAEQWIDVQAGDRLRRFLSDLLDVHPSARREQDERSLGGAIQDDRGVVLRSDRRRTFDPQLVHRQAADVHAEDRARLLARLCLVCRDLDPAEFAPATDLDLRLDRARIADLVGGGDRGFAVCRDPALRHGYAVAGEQLLALVLEEIHQRARTLNDVHNCRRAPVTGRSLLPREPQLICHCRQSLRSSPSTCTAR